MANTADAAAEAPVGAAPTQPQVSIVIINTNGADALEVCLDSLLADERRPSAEILVVDNASTDRSPQVVEAAAERDGSVRLLRSETNRGYAAAANFALPEVRGTYLAILNEDLTFETGWLEQLVSFMESTPDAGAVSPLIVLKSDPGEINAAGQYVNVTGLGFNHLLGKPRGLAGQEPFRVNGLHGAAFVIRVDLLRELGGWEESGFLYHEDVELSWLLRLAGREIYCVPRSTVTHDYHLTMFPRKLYLLERNRAAMLLTDLKLHTRLALAPLLLLSELMIWGYCLLRGGRFLRAKLDSYLWIGRQRRRIRERRRFVKGIRRNSDWEVLRGLRWGYPIDQFASLARERGESKRKRLLSH